MTDQTKEALALSLRLVLDGAPFLLLLPRLDETRTLQIDVLSNLTTIAMAKEVLGEALANIDERSTPPQPIHERRPIDPNTN